jgi:single-strand DNA-binding protein
MPLPSISGIARLVDDPELRFTSSGAPVANLRLVFNNRRLNQQTQQWEDGDTFWVRAVAWKNLAENVAETLTKGMEVTVVGDLKTESWEKDGQKHSQPSLTIRYIGPSLAFSVATVSKAPSTQQGGGQQQASGQRAQQRPQAARPQAQPPTDDPWATGAQEPPF